MQEQQNVFIVPLGCFEEESRQQVLGEGREKQFKKRADSQGDEFLIGCFGFINANKRPEQLLSAVECLIEKGYAIKVVFLGELNHDPLRKFINESNLEGIVVITGYLEPEEYITGIKKCDLVINLRYPSMGESSGTLIEAFKYGKAVLVSDINQYTEFPDEICWKVPVGRYEIPVLEKMIEYLIQHPDVRSVLGENAREYADNVFAQERIAELYHDVLQKIYLRKNQG
jgi:glycosyltransferase involved in cell wall biosynthesis